MDQLLFFRDKALELINSCCQGEARLKINGRSFKVVKVLGEGGFSFVYLVQDIESGRIMALKKIRCPTGTEAVKEAMREVEAYRRFRHPNIIRIMDSAVVDDRDGDGKIVYLFLPFYRRGNLQDIISSNDISGTSTPEKQLLQLFRGACLGVRAMHTYTVPDRKNKGKARASGEGPGLPTSITPSMPQSSGARSAATDTTFDGDHESRALLSHPASAGTTEGDFRDADDEGEGEGFTYAEGPSLTQVSRKMGIQDDSGRQIVFDGDEELGQIEDASNRDGAPAGTEIPYAHRDIKPANIMIDDNGEAILMDFGSATKARVHIVNRQQALIQQDIAAEQSTMPYRAPELFDVKSDTTLDEKVDIWSLGCTLFAVAYGYSPFETPQTLDQGGSVAMAVLNGQYKYPNTGSWSDGLKAVIDKCLKTNPKERLDIHQLINEVDQLLRSAN